MYNTVPPEKLISVLSEVTLFVLILLAILAGLFFTHALIVRRKTIRTELHRKRLNHLCKLGYRYPGSDKRCAKCRSYVVCKDVCCPSHCPYYKDCVREAKTILPPFFKSRYYEDDED